MLTWGVLGLFNLLVIGLLALDLGVFHRKSHEVTAREASTWTVVWVTLALLWGVGIYFWRGTTPALEYLTGYLMEESLSVDNIFVFVMILSYFKVPKQYQHRVLFWGVIGALVLRASFILVGAALITRFHWILYLFGAFLVFTGIKMGLKNDEEVELDENGLVRWVRKFLPVTSRYHYDHFFVREAGRLAATPLLLVLLMIESSDIIFAFDSIPAIFSVTQDPFIVYTSNIFAIMGLRSLFFLLAAVVDKFRFLRYGIAAVLTFVGVKMLVGIAGIHISILASLGVIVLSVAVSVLASILIPHQEPPIPKEPAQRVKG